LLLPGQQRNSARATVAPDGMSTRNLKYPYRNGSWSVMSQGAEPKFSFGLLARTQASSPTLVENAGSSAVCADATTTIVDAAASITHAAVIRETR
jgi:hypothetical protein